MHKIHIDSKRVQEALFPKEPGPIITSLTQTDVYKLYIGQFIHRHFPDTQVTFGMINRSRGIRFADIVSEEDFRRELDFVRTLRFSEEEIADISNLKTDGVKVFEGKGEYFEFLRGLKLPAYELSVNDGQFCVDFPGQWQETTYWETIALPILNNLRTRAVLRNMSPDERELVFKYAEEKIREKVEFFLDNPLVHFVCFGHRRAATTALELLIDEIMAEHLPSNQFLGTSNVYNGRVLGIMRRGTNAHETKMVMAGLADHDEEALRNSQWQELDMWYAEYDRPLAIFLPDTYGSKFILNGFGRERAQNWKGGRQDSGIPEEFGEKQIAMYKHHDVDPREKAIIPSDGLTTDKMGKLEAYFRNRLMVSFGLGTHLTNDIALPGDNRLKPASVVAKPKTANGRGLVKLSDNDDKYTGPREKEGLYRRVFGNSGGFHETCVV